MKIPRLSGWTVVVAVLLSGLALPTVAHAAVTYSGQAFASELSLSGVGLAPIRFADTGALPPEGGFRSASVLSATVDGTVSAGVLVASTTGANETAASSASVAELYLLPGHPAQVTASFVRSESRVTCSTVSGNTELADLSFGGIHVDASPAPNQRFDIPGVATLIVNEQIPSSEANRKAITVHALHLRLSTGDEVIVSSASSDIEGCPPPIGPCHDFVTGGGWIAVGSGRANFGFNAGFRDGHSTPDFHFTYIDHTAGMKIKGFALTTYVEGASKDSRHMDGSAEINGVPGYTLSLDVADNGEPGRKADVFQIRLSTGYSAGGTLEGGNIQLHAPCR